MFNHRLQALRVVLARNPKYSLFSINDDGTVVNKADPTRTYRSIEEVVTDMDNYADKVSDFRMFGPGVGRVSQRVGAASIEGQTEAINRYLNSSAMDQTLERFGLGFMKRKKHTGKLPSL
jgi:hypothetical protein